MNFNLILPLLISNLSYSTTSNKNMFTEFLKLTFCLFTFRFRFPKKHISYYYGQKFFRPKKGKVFFLLKNASFSQLFLLYVSCPKRCFFPIDSHISDIFLPFFAWNWASFLCSIQNDLIVIGFFQVKLAGKLPKRNDYVSRKESIKGSRFQNAQITYRSL